MATVELSLSEADLEALAERVAAKLADRLKPASNTNGSTKELWSEKETATVIGVSVYSLQRWRRDGLIAAASDRRPVRYSRADIDAIKEFLRTR